jgi:hypothetical protein
MDAHRPRHTMNRHKRNAVRALMMLYMYHDQRGESIKASLVASALIATRVAFMPSQHIAT